MKFVAAGLALVVASAFALHPGSATAKGPEYIVIGGGDLAPYYYAIPEAGPINGWLGLLLNDVDHPAGKIDAPADSRTLLSQAYTLWFSDVPDQREPNALFVPASASHPAYLYWQTPSGGMPYVAWFTLDRTASDYLDSAVDAARLRIAGGGPELPKDWIAAEFQDPYYTEPPPIASGTYWVTETLDFSPDMKPLAVIADDAAARLLAGYAAALHNWNPLPPGGVRGYKVFTPAGRELFTYVPAAGRMPAQVMPAEAGGLYDAGPVLTDVLQRALPGGGAITADPGLSPPQQSTWKVLASAAVVAATLCAALGGLTILLRARARRRAKRELVEPVLPPTVGGVGNSP